MRRTFETIIKYMDILINYANILTSSNHCVIVETTLISILKLTILLVVLVDVLIRKYGCLTD